MQEEILDVISVYRDVKTQEFNHFNSFKFFDEANCGTDKITIMHLNIRSYNKNIDELLVILNYYTNKFDVIVLTETWMDDCCVPVSMDGYDVIVNQRSRNQNDGVVVYVRKPLMVCHEEVCLYGATSIKVELSFGGERLALFAVYRSPSSDLELFINNLEELLGTRRRGGQYWLVGDLNCCILPNNTNPLSQRYLDVMYGAGFISCINVPTRVTATTQTCIDHIFTDILNTNRIKSAVIKTEITDHFITLVMIDVDKGSKDTKLNDETKSSFVDWVAVRQLLSTQNWSHVLETGDVDGACALFIEQLQEIVTKSTKFKAVTSKKAKLKPWITAGLINSIRNRDKLSKQLKKQPFNLLLKLRFRHYRNVLNSSIKRTKEVYYRNRVVNSINNSKSLWASISEIIGLDKKKDAFPISGFLDNSGAKDVNELADELNKYYVNVGADLARAVPPVTECVVNDEEYSLDTDFQLLPISESELVKVVQDLKGGSAPDQENEIHGERSVRWRDEWAAKPPVTELKPMAKPIVTVILTYTGSAPCEGIEECDREVRSLQDRFQKNLGLPDLPYSFYVSKDGYIYEGRGWDYKPFVPLKAFPKLRGTRIVIAQINENFDSSLLPRAEAAIWDLIQYGVENNYIHPHAEKLLSSPWI